MDKKFANLLIQIHKALDILEKTGERIQFIAVFDQIETYQKEENKKIESKENQKIKCIKKLIKDEVRRYKKTNK